MKATVRESECTKQALDNESENLEGCCAMCKHFYDEWADGTGKCAKAHGGITTSNNVCKLFTDYED